MKSGWMGKSGLLPGKIIAGTFFCVLLFVIIYKVLHVPITFDEKGTCLNYPRFTVWEIMMYPDNWPANHILNTLSIKFSEHFFGVEPWTVRLPAMLSFVLFYFIMYLIAVRYFRQTWIVFCLPFFIMFCNPFLVDFYGLARGYGMSNALMACSVYALLRFTSSFSLRWYFVTIAFAMLAAYANFTLLIYWVAVQILLVVILLVNTLVNKQLFRKNSLLVLVTGIIAGAFLALCYVPLHKMQSTNQFIFWSKESFFNDTVKDQVYNFGYRQSYFFIPEIYVAQAVIVLLVSTLVYAIYKMVRKRQAALSDPLVILVLLIFTVWLVNMAQTTILGTPYLTTRTALSYYVLFAFVLMFLLKDLSERIRWVGYSIVPAIIILFAVHFATTVSLKYVREWAYDANTYRVLDYLKDYRQKHREIKTVELNSNCLFNPSFSFYTESGKVPWLKLTEYHNYTDTTSQTLFYYCRDHEAVKLPDYHIVLSFPWNNDILMMRKTAEN